MTQKLQEVNSERRTGFRFMYSSMKGFLIKRIFHPPTPSKGGHITLKINRLSPFGRGWGWKRVDFTISYLTDYQRIIFL